MEITDLNRLDLQQGSLTVEIMGHGYAWLETSQFIAMLENRQGLKAACLEEIA